ncbi:MAG: acylphosphatase [Chloroflexi bacterium]|nr:acylphosphatase [Chloroflexota bacterium]
MSQDDVTPEIVRLNAQIRGRVQGVGFRDFCIRIARSLSGPAAARVTGYVRNLPSGTEVEVVAEASRDQLDRLLAELHIGPAGAHVIAIEASFSAATREFDGFTWR